MSWPLTQTIGRTKARGATLSLGGALPLLALLVIGLVYLMRFYPKKQRVDRKPDVLSSPSDSRTFQSKS